MHYTSFLKIEKNKETSNNFPLLIEGKIFRYLSKEEDKIIEILII